MGSDASSTADRSPMSMPISRVGVATSTFGAFGSLTDCLNSLSYRSRVWSGTRLVCSRATIRRMSADAYRRR